MASLAMELNNNNNGINNLTSQMTKLTIHPTEMQVMRFHGRLGNQLTASEKQLINRHLDIIQIVQDGELCMSTDNAEHPELIAKGARHYGPSLWEKSQLGDKQRAEMASILQQKFPGGFSNNIMLWTGDRNWEFSNKTKQAELMTLQNVGNTHASNATQYMKENFTLVDLAEKVSTRQLPNENAMNINSNHGLPQRKKIIIMAFKGDSGGGSGAKKTGGRRKKYTRKRKQKKKRRKSRRIVKRRKTRKRRRRRKRK